MTTSNSGFKNFVAGGVGGICLVVSGHPLDTIKVRLQTEINGTTGMISCARSIIRSHGFLGLYKGMLLPLVGVMPTFALYFWGYGVGQNFIRVMSGHKQEREMTLVELGIAGGFSGIFTTVITAPGERVKCILQTQDAKKQVKYSGPKDVIRSIYRENGLGGIYRGSLITVLRDVPASFAYFVAYEATNRYFKKRNQSSPATVLLAGGLAGVANWLVGLPFDTVKSRLQIAPEGTYTGGFRQVFRELVAKEGYSALYKGLGPVMARAFPANACCFLGVDLTHRLFQYL
eukprot:NODE_561_length_1366_cov_89.420500_g525_i0.p1 GENE.NODE_561_length_1366_cov_89.420500_g525_i0~~NODE_561_length_1366_cov_89.420500_g525_i0.p1  ORF type:complete len:288 (-),score=31.43 NODE_561_length_1366_cov_89.420500_g525_i0:293-1156(-)